jgi:tRNA1(Val) A37 N6-methylase TrmN6
MTEKQLKDIFQQTYAFPQWKQVFDDIFPNKEYLQKPASVEDSSGKTKSVLQLGTIRLLNNRNIIILEAEVKKNIQIVKNRRELRDIASKFIDQTNNHGVFIFYYSEDKNQLDYRLSFISRVSEIDEDGNFQKFETAKKRYTYLLGVNESGTTAAKRLLELAAKAKQNNNAELKDVIEAFSVDKLNKDFFITYKKQFEKFSNYLAANKKIASGIFKIREGKTKEEQAKNEKPIRDFTKKLLGRIVFLYFLQKKGWLGCWVFPTTEDNKKIWIDGDKMFMQNLFKNFKQQEHFHSKCLKELFFYTLNNNDRKNFIFSVTKTRVPYLNGGLFDDDMPTTQEIDFPVDYFKDLLDFFEQYNFTIDENSPDEHEVGIDPEMLGHIFENLLEENREKGAFYTPKEIVHYMCQESLIQYLHTHLGKHKAVEDFIRTGNVGDKKDKNNFIVKNAKLIEEKLDAVKICDPAIGSGAFPMGILQEIFKAKTALDLTLDRAKAKKDIIQNTIYGVDMEKGAVDIARLRFWLALVVDEEVPQPLPNLDYKIMQGNSLLEQFDDITLKFEKKKFQVKLVKAVDLFGKVINAQTSITEFLQTKQAIAEFSITELEDKYFNSNNPNEKRSIREKIENFEKEFIAIQLKEREDETKEQLKAKQKELDLDLDAAPNKPAQANLMNSRRAKEVEKLKQALEKIKENKKRLAAIKPEEKPYFLWHLYFMDVFNSGGFDIVIGNPPYIQLQKMGKDCNDLENAEYKTFSRTGDIYCLFYEQGSNILKENGTLCYITSNTWMRTKFGELLRKYFAEHTNPVKLLNFEDTKIFQTATVEVNIILTTNSRFKKGLNAVAVKADYSIGTSINEYFTNNFIELTELPNDGWIILNKQDYRIKTQIEKEGKQLKDWNVEMNFALKSGFNDAFFIDEITKEQLIKDDANSREVIKPLIRGRNIRKYNYRYDNIYILYLPWHFPLKDIEEKNDLSLLEKAEKQFKKLYPAVYKHMLQFKKELSARNKAETGIRYEWYALQRPSATFVHNYEKEKIVWLAITDKPAFALDTKKMYVTNPSYIMVADRLKYHLGLLNSRLIEWYLDKISSSTGQGTNQWTKIYMDQIPIPEIKSDAMLNKFEIVVEYLIYLNDESKLSVNPHTSNASIAPVFEDVLNMMVYELYFEQHMKDEEIDVLKYVDERLFPSLTSDEKENARLIGKTYKQLQEQENSIRNRIILSNLRSKNIIRRINSTTH